MKQSEKDEMVEKCRDRFKKLADRKYQSSIDMIDIGQLIQLLWFYDHGERSDELYERMQKIYIPYVIRLENKILEIGDWDMNADDNIGGCCERQKEND